MSHPDLVADAKPCPYCRGTNILRIQPAETTANFLSCTDCGLIGPTFRDIAAALKAWQSLPRVDGSVMHS